MTTVPLLLAPGASGSIERLRPIATALQAAEVPVELVQLPKGKAERAMPVYRSALDGREIQRTAIGGHSFGGRVASLVAAGADPPPAAVVLLSYPLHAPGRQAAWDERTSHWPTIHAPVLLLSGEADPFADLDLLRAAVRRLPDARLRTWPRLGHGLGPVLHDAASEIAAFLAERG